MANCGWCIDNEHTKCKPYGRNGTGAWFCECNCLNKEARDAIRESDDVRSRIQEWAAQDAGLDNKRRRRKKRGVPSG